MVFTIYESLFVYKTPQSYYNFFKPANFFFIFVRKIVYINSVDSTNEEAKRHSDYPEGSLFIAENQTAGKGRRGRAWQSPAGKNLYFSILLRPTVEPDQASMVTLLMALAVQKAVTAVSGIKAAIKWPNDVIMNGKKITGILTEMFLENDKIDFVVIGTGINVKEQTFPAELVNAGDIETESGKQIDRKELLQEVLRNFMPLYRDFLTEGNLSFIRNDYENALVNKEKEVLIRLDDK